MLFRVQHEFEEGIEERKKTSAKTEIKGENSDNKNFLFFSHSVFFRPPSKRLFVLFGTFISLFVNICHFDWFIL